LLKAPLQHQPTCWFESCNYLVTKAIRCNTDSPNCILSTVYNN